MTSSLSISRLQVLILLPLFLFPAISCWQCTAPSTKRTQLSAHTPPRRQVLLQIPLITSTLLTTSSSAPFPALARAPGSKDITESMTQIQDAVVALETLQQNWNQYATIDAEGRAGSTDAARRILGGIAPQAGQTAIEVAKQTPLYRIDGAFKAIRQAALLDGSSDVKWLDDLDLSRFEELVERILFAIQKADGDFYSVLFAAKGTTQISGIYKEAKAQVNQAVLDLKEMIQLFREAGAPGL